MWNWKQQPSLDPQLGDSFAYTTHYLLDICFAHFKDLKGPFVMDLLISDLDGFSCSYDCMLLVLLGITTYTYILWNDKNSNLFFGRGPQLIFSSSPHAKFNSLSLYERDARSKEVWTTSALFFLVLYCIATTATVS